MAVRSDVNYSNIFLLTDWFSSSRRPVLSVIWELKFLSSVSVARYRSRYTAPKFLDLWHYLELSEKMLTPTTLPSEKVLQVRQVEWSPKSERTKMRGAKPPPISQIKLRFFRPSSQLFSDDSNFECSIYPLLHSRISILEVLFSLLSTPVRFDSEPSKE
jgi:hypothetical protein